MPERAASPASLPWRPCRSEEEDEEEGGMDLATLQAMMVEVRRLSRERCAAVTPGCLIIIVWSSAACDCHDSVRQTVLSLLVNLPCRWCASASRPRSASRCGATSLHDCIAAMHMDGWRSGGCSCCPFQPPHLILRTHALCPLESPPALPPASPPQGQLVADLEKEVGEQLAAKEKELKGAQKQLEDKASPPAC